MDLDNSVSYLSDAIQPGGVVLSCNGNLDAFTFRYVIIPGGVAAGDIAQGYLHIAAKYNFTP
jgi:hypothetical protein